MSYLAKTRAVFASPLCLTPGSTGCRRVASEPAGSSFTLGLFGTVAKRRRQVSYETRFDLRAWRRHTDILELSDREPLVTAGVDVGEGREIHVFVERKAVVGAAVANFQAQRGYFGDRSSVAQVYAGGIRPAVRVNMIR